MSVQSKSFVDRVLPRNPVTERRELRLIPESWEIALGSYLYKGKIFSEGGAYDNDEVQKFVKKIGMRLAKVSKRSHLPYEFTAIDSKQINAWCMPGGKIAIYTQLIKKMRKEKGDLGVGHFDLEQKVAAVLAHELTHAAARHSARGLEFAVVLSTIMKAIQFSLSIFIGDAEMKLKRQPKNEEEKKQADQMRLKLAVANFVNFFFSNCYNLIYNLAISHGSRSKELEADKGGIYNMVAAGYDPRAAIWVQKFLEKQSGDNDDHCLKQFIRLFHSHPSSAERAKINAETIAEINNKKKPKRRQYKQLSRTPRSAA